MHTHTYMFSYRLSDDAYVDVTTKGSSYSDCARQARHKATGIAAKRTAHVEVMLSALRCNPTDRTGVKISEPEDWHEADIEASQKRDVG